MNKISNYLSESLDHLDVIIQHLNAGSIVKPLFDQVKRAVDRQVSDEGQKIFNKHCVGTGKEMAALGLEDLVYGVPTNIHEVKSLGSKLAKNKVRHPFVSDLQDFHDRWKPVRDKFEELKTKVVTTTQKRQEAKVVATKQQEKRFYDSSSLVGALTKHLNEFVERSKQHANNHYDDIMKQLDKHGWDLDKFAPRKSTMAMTKATYRQISEKRKHVLELTDGKKNLRQPSENKKNSYVKSATDAAHANYMAWVDKMIKKIGKPVAEASMTGDPWTGSRLYVKAGDGEEQTWATKMIINYSKYSKAFNQFPSRRVK